MIDHDRLFKELLTSFFLEFIELFFPEVHVDLDPDSIEFLDKEVFTDVTSGEKHEADLVVKARFRGQDWFFLFHVEPQSYQDDPFDRRMFQYFARLYEKHKLPIYPVAIFSYGSPQRPEPSTHRVEFPGFTVLEFNFRVIQLNRLHWREFLRHKNPVAAALMARMKMKPQERKQVKLECLRLLATLKLNPAKMQLIAGFVDTYLRLIPEEENWVREEIKKFDSVSKEVVMEIVTSWEERGKEIGLQQGLQQGSQQEALAISLRLLRHKIGELSPESEMRIRNLSVAQLEDLSLALLEFNDASDLAAWLDKNENQTPVV
jgi:predicted transposase YdaD